METTTKKHGQITNTLQLTSYLEDNNKGKANGKHSPELFGDFIWCGGPRRLSVVLISSETGEYLTLVLIYYDITGDPLTYPKLVASYEEHKKTTTTEQQSKKYNDCKFRIQINN